MIYIVALGNLLMAGVFALAYNSLPPQIPLFFSRQTGEDQLGEWWMIFFIPIFMNLLTAVNVFLVRKYFPSNDFVKKVCDYVNVGLIVGFTALFIKIVLLVS